MLVAGEILTAGLLIGAILGGMIGTGTANRRADQRVAQVEKEWKEKMDQKSRKLEEQLATAYRSYEELLDQNNEKKERVLPWNLTLVNASHPLPSDYTMKLAEVTGGYYVDERIVEPLNQMLADARKAGVNIMICSAYRSVDKQIQVFNDSLKERLNQGMNYWEAYQDNAKSVALPGTSEHSLGLALDLISTTYTELDEKQAETAEAKWLAENSYKYGFVLRYPPDKTVLTGIIYEPWHYRYVGLEDAKKMKESGLTLEEYVENY